MVVVRTQIGHMNQALNEYVAQSHEQAKMSHTRHRALKHIANVLKHIAAFVTRLHMPGRIIGEPLLCGTTLALLLHRRLVIAKASWFGAGEDMRDTAVDEQVRITPNRRCEVRIGIQRQPEMADVCWLIEGLAHTAQHSHGQNLVVVPIRNGPERAVQVAGVSLCLRGDLDTELLQQQSQFLEFLLGRPFVHPEQRGQTVATEELCGLHVGRNHTFLD